MDASIALNNAMDERKRRKENLGYLDAKEKEKSKEKEDNLLAKVSVFIAVMETQQDNRGGSIPRYGVIHRPFAKKDGGDQWLGLTIYGGKGFGVKVAMPDGDISEVLEVPRIKAGNKCQVTITGSTLYPREKAYLKRLGIKTRNDKLIDDDADIELEEEFGRYVREQRVRLDIMSDAIGEPSVDKLFSMLCMKDPEAKETFGIVKQDFSRNPIPVFSIRIQKQSYAAQQALGDDAYATCEHDLSAFLAIYEACGGTMIDRNGDPMRFNLREGMKLENYILFPIDESSNIRDVFSEQAWSENETENLPVSLDD